MACHPLKCQICCCTIPQRYFLVFMIFASMVLMYCQRNNISLTLTQMVVKRKQGKKGNVCPSGNKSAAIKVGGGKYDWNENTQSYILQCFYIGYVLGNFWAGWLCDTFGPRWPIQIGVCLSTLVTLLTPIVAQKTNWIVLVVMRVLCGFGQSIVVPGLTTFLSRWAPARERALLGSFVYAGSSIGMIIGGLGSGFLMTTYRNWPVVFYFYGLLGIVWSLVYALYCYSAPTTHPFITIMELEYLKVVIPQEKRMKTPVGAIMTDISVWALVLGQVAHNYILFTLTSNLPKYMSDVLNYNVKRNTVSSSMPYLCMYIGSVTCGWIGDRLTRVNANVAWVRKVITAIANLIPACFMVAAGYNNCNKMHAEIFFSLALFFKGFFFSGLKVNAMDLTTHHAGFVMSVMQGFGSLAGCITPMVIARMAPNNTLKEWHYVFWILFTVVWLLTIFYIIFGAGRRRKWDYAEGEYESLPPPVPHKWYLQDAPEIFKAKKAAQAEKWSKMKAEAEAAKIKAKEIEIAARNEKLAEKAAKKAARQQASQSNA